jgi:hypothetical protein
MGNIYDFKGKYLEFRLTLEVRTRKINRTYKFQDDAVIHKGCQASQIMAQQPLLRKSY